MLLIVSLRLQKMIRQTTFGYQSDLIPALDCPMNKPNAQGESLLARFTEANNHLKACHELLDSIASEPFIPSYRHDQFAHISDKINNVQENLHWLQKNLAHLG